MKALDRLLGSAVISIMSPPSNSRATPPSRMLIIRPGGIGDAVLLIPAIRAVKSRFPSLAIDVLAEKRNSQVFSLCDVVDRILHYDRLTEFVSAMRGAYDVVIDTEQWHRLSAVVTRMLKPSVSVGFGTNERGRLFSITQPYSHEQYEVLSFLDLIEPITGTVTVEDTGPFLKVADSEDRKAIEVMESFSGKGTIALFPGASIRERRWESARFREAAFHLIGEGYGIAVVGGKPDNYAGEKIVAGLNQDSIVNLCGKLSLGETAAVLKRCAVLITGDSGIMHMGYGVGCKVVALFGPGIQAKWAPRTKKALILNKNLSCSPCTRYGYTARCTRDVECMKRISVENVLKAVNTLLADAEDTEANSPAEL